MIGSDDDEVNKSATDDAFVSTEIGMGCVALSTLGVSVLGSALVFLSASLIKTCNGTSSSESTSATAGATDGGETVAFGAGDSTGAMMVVVVVGVVVEVVVGTGSGAIKSVIGLVTSFALGTITVGIGTGGGGGGAAGSSGFLLGSLITGGAALLLGMTVSIVGSGAG